MLALSTIAVLVAGSSAAELRGVTETTSVVTPTTQKYKLKNTGFKQKKVQKATDVKLADHGLVNEEARGYILEWTRVNTDCSGRVEFVGGLSSGATHTIYGEGGAETFYVNAAVTGTKQEGTYSLESFTSSTPDGEEGWSYGDTIEDKERCTQDLSRQIPYDQIRIDEHEGYFYGHTFVAGEYSAVTSSLKGFYEELYGNKNECILGVNPVAFAVQWVKGECYFNSNTLETEDVMDKPIKHDWFKIHGVDTTTGKIEYTVHNNDECVDKNPFAKAPLQELEAPVALDTCVKSEGPNAGRDVTSPVFWVKYKGYN